MPSPTCLVKDGSGAYQSTLNGVNVTPGNTVTIALDSSAGVSTWQISCIYSDETTTPATINAGLSVNSVTKTATFTAPAVGKALIFQSRINGGIGIDGVAVGSYTTTFGIFTLTSEGKRVVALNQTFEGNSTFGWTADLNDLIRTGVTVSVANDVARSGGASGPIDRVKGFDGVAFSGTAPADNEVYVRRGSNYVAANAMPRRWYDPRAYGAALDGVTDDIAAFEAMHAAMPIRGGVVYMAGPAWLSRTWRISKRFQLLGFGGDQSILSDSGFFVAPGYTAIQYDDGGNSLDGNSAQFFEFEKVDLRSRVMVHHTATGDALGFGINSWSAVSSISVGDCRVKAASADPTYMFRAISVTANSGKGPATTTAAQPAWVLTPGATLTDGNGITWRTEKIPAVHQTSTAYVVGDRVWAPSDNRFYFECEIAGTSAGSRPAQLVGGNGAGGMEVDGTFTDGTVTWRIKTAAAIRVHANMGKIRNSHIGAFTGPAVLVAGGVGCVAAGYTDANHTKIIDVVAEWTGCGVALYGSDCNGWRVTNYWGLNIGTLLPTPNAVAAASYSGLGGHHIHDSSQASGQIDNCYGQLNSGRMILKNGIGLMTVISSFHEVNDLSLFTAGSTVLLGGHLANVAAGSTGVCAIDPAGYGRGILEGDRNGPVALSARLTKQDGYSALIFSAPEGGDVNDFALRYENGTANGCWGLFHGNQQINVAYLLYSAAAGVDYGAGWLGVPVGYLSGHPDTETPIFEGRYSGLTDTKLRNGARKKGDTFRSQTDIQTLLEDGYRGVPWVAGQPARVSYAPWAVPASVIEPTTNTGKPGEQVWRCTTAGTTGGVEPSWPASPTPGVTTQADNTVVWTFVGYRPARVLEQRAVKTRGPHLREKDVTTTLNTANQVLDDGGVVNGEDLALPENSMCIVSHTITLKKPSTANGGDITIRSTWVRNGSAAPVQIGSGATTPTYNLSGTTLDGTTVRHAANGNRIELQCTPETAETLNWGIVRTQIERVD
jgi:hypothetical protein